MGKRDLCEVLPCSESMSLDTENMQSMNMALLMSRFPVFSILPEEKHIPVMEKMLHVGALPVLSWEKAAEMSRSGIEFGAHSHSHLFLTELSDDEARTEIITSKQEIEGRLDKPLDTFCYPYGAWSVSLRNLVEELGFLGACTSEGGVNYVNGMDPFELKRIPVECDCGRLKFGAYLSLLYEYYILLKRYKKRIRSLSRGAIDYLT
jgi:hypothetical protein